MDSRSNVFRANWRYQRLEAAEGTLRSATGLSPAFRKLLAAVQPREGTSFQELATAFPRLDVDDLELWLAELCRMQLIAPAETPLPTLGEVQLQAPSEDSEEGHAESQFVAELNTPVNDIPSLAPLQTETPSVLIVGRAGDQRRSWRSAISTLPVTVLEASTIAEAEAALREQTPPVIILSADGTGFNPLQLISLLKHPRMRIPAKVYVMLDSAVASRQDLRKAAMADGALHPQEAVRLTSEIARALNLPAINSSGPSVTPPMDQFIGQPRLNVKRVKVDDELAASKLSALELRYPRVAQRITQHWGKPTLGELLNNLVFDSRGGRQGFTFPAMEELLFLLDMYNHNQPAQQVFPPKRSRSMRQVTMESRKVSPSALARKGVLAR
ncbi:MAG: hypothetical protein JWN73_3549 [Betaproteobacteria bacterium]|nr:hypothetical protein [Betaproteobacteria bacterium]